MSQRDSGYERKPLDLYETPTWVTEALLPHIPIRVQTIWEPASGSGKMAYVLGRDHDVTCTDISMGLDFLQTPNCFRASGDAIITNPPYSLADRFIEHALTLMCPTGFVAMLLRCDFDSAKGRRRFFNDCRTFTKKVTLTKRIKWFEDSDGSPSFNHAWYIWDFRNTGAPTLAYAP